MKVIRFEFQRKESYGILNGDKITHIDGDIFGEYTKTSLKSDLDDVKILPPVKPGKIIAIGLNYKKHAEEVNKPLPEEPMMFLVSPTAVLGDKEQVILKNPQNRTEHEGELAIVIGKEAKNIAESDVEKYIYGYTCSNDISDRILQKKDGQYTRAKSFDTYKPLGPIIETEMDPDNVDITVKVNGEIKQSSNTDDMIFSTKKLVSHISNIFTLYPGDIIITGTPSGVSPLNEGDIVEVSIEEIGILTNKVTIK